MGIKIVNDEPEKDYIILMKDMKPLDVGVIVGGHNDGSLVMRTASLDQFEVMDLSDPREGSCWTDRRDLHVKIRRLRKGEKYILELS